MMVHICQCYSMKIFRYKILNRFYFLLKYFVSFVLHHIKSFSNILVHRMKVHLVQFFLDQRCWRLPDCLVRLFKYLKIDQTVVFMGIHHRWWCTPSIAIIQSGFYSCGFFPFHRACATTNNTCTYVYVDSVHHKWWCTPSIAIIQPGFYSCGFFPFYPCATKHMYLCLRGFSTP